MTKFELRNFVIEGVACQPPSSLRNLQATPPLQTSLVLMTILKVQTPCHQAVPDQVRGLRETRKKRKESNRFCSIPKSIHMTKSMTKKQYQSIINVIDVTKKVTSSMIVHKVKKVIPSNDQQEFQEVFLKLHQQTLLVQESPNMASCFIFQLILTFSNHSSYNAVLLYRGILSNAVFSKPKTALKFYLTRFFLKPVKKN